MEINRTVLITGVAGFIGANLALSILNQDKNAVVIGIDNMNDYYDVSLKEFRLEKLRQMNRFVFLRGDIRIRAFWKEFLRNTVRIL